MTKENTICFFNCTPFWGGGEKLHLEYALEFKKLGYDVRVVAQKNTPFYQKSMEAQLTVEPFVVSNLSFLSLSKRKKLTQYFKNSGIDTVFISASPDLKIAAFAASNAGVKNIIYLRGLAAPIKNNLLNRKLLLKVVTHIIANSEDTKLKMTANFNSQVLNKKVKVIYHGIDLALFDKNLNEQNNLNLKTGNTIILGNAGRLTKQKGQQYLIEVAKFLEEAKLDFKLIIAGSGEEEENLKALIKGHQLEHRIQLLGFVEQMEGFMKSIDIFLLSSIWEGFGYVIVEAMAAKKPIVAFNITSNPEIIEQNKTGYLIEFPNTKLFADKILDMALSPQQLIDMGNAGRIRAEQKFQLNTIIKEIEAYIFN